MLFSGRNFSSTPAPAVAATDAPMSAACTATLATALDRGAVVLRYLSTQNFIIGCCGLTEQLRIPRCARDDEREARAGSLTHYRRVARASNPKNPSAIRGDALQLHPGTQNQPVRPKSRPGRLRSREVRAVHGVHRGPFRDVRQHCRTLHDVVHRELVPC